LSVSSDKWNSFKFDRGESVIGVTIKPDWFSTVTQSLKSKLDKEKIAMKRTPLFIAIAVLVIGLVLVACAPTTPTPANTPPPAQPTAAGPQPTAVPTPPPLDIPFLDMWKGSAHADAKAEAFNHWNKADPVAVPKDCARCHTTTGYQEFVASGPVSRTVTNDQPIGQVLTCVACHNEATAKLTNVTFPSGLTIENLGPEARCMQCHQGRASGATVDAAIKKANLTDMDTVSKDLGFTNIHYLAAGAMLYGSEAAGGYQYAGQSYDQKFRHVPSKDTCLGCHNQHSLQVKVDECAACHKDVKTKDDLKNIRMNGSLKDYNGNGDVKEGIAAELDGLRTTLYSAIQAYAKDVAKTPLVYDTATYPYFFVDTNGNGQPDKDETVSANGFKAWTARLAKAAYNYQTSIKDPGFFAHNAKYAIELIYDSIADLNTKLSAKIDMTKMARDDAGHFAGTQMPFRDWDNEGEVPFRCAKCHTSDGLPTFIAAGGTVLYTTNGTTYSIGTGPTETANGFLCTTCHSTPAGPELIPVVNVPFPSGAQLTFSKDKDAKGALIPVESNICIECHQGRESTGSMNAYLNSLKPKSDDEVVLRADGKTPAISFKNIHYFAAGATLFGTEAKGAYEYADQKYLGRNLHNPQEKFTQCVQCHNTHTQQVQVDKCAACHDGLKTVEDLKTIRMSATDFNGNGDVKEGIFKEVDSFRQALYAAIQKYAETKAGTPITYDPASYPYFFVDKDKDGKADKNDKGAVIGYNAWTPRLLKAAYDYQASVKDPGTFAHNPKYVMQYLYDATKDVGGDVSKFTRPEVPAAPK
jgi:hypothetical protein